VSGPTLFLAGTEREHTIDPETLHEVPTRSNDLVMWVGRNRRAPAPADPEGELRHRTELGVAARLVGALSLAERELARAADLAAGVSETAALRAGLRLAHVYQWQGHFAVADAEFQRYVAEATVPADRALAHQHAGQCAYDVGDVDRAATHFAAALRLRDGGEPGLVESSLVALDAADACRTAVAVGTELHRLVPAGHATVAAALRTGNTLPERPAELGPLVELRTLLLAGPVPEPVLVGLFRYSDEAERAVGELIETGWLTDTGDALAATPRCRTLLTALMATMDSALGKAWDDPALVATLESVVRGAIGTSDGPVFDAMAAATPRTGRSIRLFELCNALRHHRADAHAAAWRAAGLNADSVRELSPGDLLRREVETGTNRIASRPYRSLSTKERAELVTRLGSFLR
jgi:hypothetical protein